MSNIIWTKTKLEEFISEALLTKDEEFVLRTRIAGWSRVKQAENLGISLGTLDRIIRRVKDKYEDFENNL